MQLDFEDETARMARRELVPGPDAVIDDVTIRLPRAELVPAEETTIRVSRRDLIPLEPGDLDDLTPLGELDEDEDGEPVSMRDLEMILAPGVAPPALSLRGPVALEAMLEDVDPIFSSRDGHNERRAARAMAVLAGAPIVDPTPLPPRVVASVPPPPESLDSSALEPDDDAPPLAPRETTRLSWTPEAARRESVPPLAGAGRAREPGTRDLEMMGALNPTGTPPPLPPPRARMATLPGHAPPPGRTSTLLPPPRRGSQPSIPPAPPSESGIPDVQRLSEVHATASKERVDQDVANLSGGLFSGLATSTPTPLDLSPLVEATARTGGPNESIAPTISTVPPPPLPKISDAPVSLPARLAAPKGDRPRRTGFVLVGLAAAAAFGLLTLRQPGGEGHPTAVLDPGGRSLAAPAPEAPPADLAALPAPAPADPAPAAAEPTLPEGDGLDDVTVEHVAPPAPPRETAVVPVAAPAPLGAPIAAAPKPTTPGVVAPTTPPPPAAPAPEGSPAGASGTFDVAAANAGLSKAAAAASSCRAPGDPTGTTRVSVTFAPSGRATAAQVSGPPFAGTLTGSCIAKTFRGATVPAFEGAPRTVNKNVSIR